MKTNLWIVLVSLSLFTCHEGLETIENVGDGIFSNSQNLAIDTIKGTANFPQFDLNDLSLEEHLYIAVFEEPIIVENQEIKNQDAIIWQWDSSLEKVGLVEFHDGVLLDSTYLISNILCKELPKLYWAAWTWDEQFIKITHSTRQHSFELVPDNLPKLVISQVDVIQDENADNYLQAGERLSLKAIIKNESAKAAESIKITLLNDKTADLPISTSIESLSGNEIQDVKFTFRLPENVSLQEVLSFNFQISYNDCLSSEVFSYEVAISGRAICLKNITLVKILAEPREGYEYWDADVQLGRWNPDVYYILSEEGNESGVIRSETLDEMPVDNPQGRSWSSLDPCKSLKLDRLYSIDVYDKDVELPPLIYNPYDFIGNISFTPNQFLDEASSTHNISSEDIELRLELEWR
ncbi:MAG: hypothetical protein AAGG68_15940 [Bacteroidota bacterium]